MIFFICLRRYYSSEQYLLNENVCLIKPVRIRYPVNVAWGKRKEVGVGVHVETLDLKCQGTTHLAGYSQVMKIAIKCILYKIVVMMSLLQRYLMTLI